MSQKVGVVLAGGAGKRMGRSKGDLQLDGRPLAERAVAALWPFCASVLISVPPGGVNPAPDYPAVEDQPPAGRGPLAGLDAAFAATGQADLLVLACDYPRIEPRLLRRLISQAAAADDVVIPVDPAGRDHPLVGVWRRRTARVVHDAVADGRLAVRSLLSEFEVRRLTPVDFPGFDLARLLLNLNWPADLEKL